MAKLKTVWTDAHTVLGTIGLPFQAVYAVTGAFFMIRIFLLIPNVVFLYNGDENKIYQDLGYNTPVYTFENTRLARIPDIQPYVARTESTWKNFDVTQVTIVNYGDKGMHVTVAGELDTSVKFNGLGEVIYQVAENKILNQKDPNAQTTYLDGVKNALYRLHFGDYGGYAVRITSFLLGILSCFVIITGILIWLEARNKKSIPEKRRRFNEWIGHIYLAICLAMYPVTALSFIVTKLVPREYDASRQVILYSVFFITWLLLSVVLALRKSNYTINRFTLLTGGVLGLFIPVVQGIVTGNWIWISLRDNQLDLVVVDTLWIAISLFTLIGVYRMKKPKPQEEEPVRGTEKSVKRSKIAKPVY